MKVQFQNFENFAEPLSELVYNYYSLIVLKIFNQSSFLRHFYTETVNL